MKIREAIRKADMIRENELPPEVKLGWLSGLDGAIWYNLHSQYAGQRQAPPDWLDFSTHPPDPVPVPPVMPHYDEETDQSETDLLIQAPWDEIYVTYLVMRIDLENNDIERYNNGAELYAKQYQDYANAYTREHFWAKPKPLRF